MWVGRNAYDSAQQANVAASRRALSPRSTDRERSSVQSYETRCLGSRNSRLVVHTTDNEHYSATVSCNLGLTFCARINVPLTAI